MALFSFKIIPVGFCITTLYTVQAYSAPCSHKLAASSFDTWGQRNRFCRSEQFGCMLKSIRGGNQEKIKENALLLVPVLSAMSRWGESYVRILETHPIVAKSVTAGIIFGLSDTTAQILESSRKAEKKGKLDKKRLLASVLVGLLYFGPAAHKWYEWIFKLLPATTVLSTCYKAALGQLIFGPCFTCVFFAVGLLQSGEFTIQRWFKKIQKDLFGVWTAGLGYWPIADFISYAWVPVMWIPLFINFCSFIWTIYLSLVTNAQAQANPEK